MNRFFHVVVLSLMLLLTGCQSFCQRVNPPFQNEIRAFKRQDSIVMPPKHQILMIGSSSFTMWRDVNHFLPGYPLINRGFGGSTLPDLIRYFDDIVRPYQPAQVLIYCGENDIAAGASADTVFARFKSLFQMLREQNPRLFITYVAMKPSPSRQKWMGQMQDGNNQIKNWLSTQKQTSFVNVYDLMLDKEGHPVPAIFLEDMLHMNAKGYEIWAAAIAPHLQFPETR